MEFSAHGEFTLQIKDNILLVDATGPFNEETASQYVSQYQDYIIRYQPKLQLSQLHGSSIFSPEIEEALVQLHQWSAQRGLRAEAVLLDTDPNERAILTMQAKNIFADIQTTYKLFYSKEEAMTWLHSFL